jgi:DNA-binding transcriptional regulator YhcF (GntR family)
MEAKNLERGFRNKRVAKPMEKFFTINELAEHFGVNPKTIYRRLWAKQTPA